MVDNNVIFENVRKADPEELSTDVLAYIGDAVYELYFRLYTLRNAKRRTFHQYQITKNYVSAEGQSKALKEIWDQLSKECQNIVRRGYNSKGAKRKGDDRDYKRATGLEALVGYLFLKGKNHQLLLILHRVSKHVSSW
ncbi:MAG: Mini-ribonuclease 3 [Kosmotoga sp.]|nr:MAG: Mini-ribonuclease 3 [Kosmotoga sp.]